MRNTMINTKLLAQLLALATGLSVSLSAETARAQGCPGPGSTLSVPITVEVGDGSITSSVPFGINRDGARWQNASIAIGTTQYPLVGAIGNGVTQHFTFVAGGNDYFVTEQKEGASCSQSGTGDGGCTVTCTGGATITVYSNHGSFHAQVSRIPQDAPPYQVGLRWVDQPGSGSNWSTESDGTLQLPSYSAVNNWSQFLLQVGDKGERTAVFSVNPQNFGPGVTATTSSNKNPLVLLVAMAPYYEVPNTCQAPPAPPNAKGEPVCVTTGEMYFQQMDASAGDLVFGRFYSSERLTSGRHGSLGAGWNTTMEARLSFPESGVIEARDASGAPAYFVDSNADGIYEGRYPPDPLTWIEAVPSGGFKRKHAAGGEDVFTSVGRLSSSTDTAGVETTYTRNGLGLVASIVRLGRSLAFTYSGAQLTRVEDGAGTLLASYRYDLGARLEGVTYPDGTGYTFGYDDAGRLIFVGDLGGRMLERHDYDSLGRATTSEVDQGQQKYTFTYGSAPTAYGNASTTVTDALGNVTTYDFIPVAGRFLVARITGACSECGGGAGDVQEWTYDDNGNILTRKDAAGKTWSYTYDTVLHTRLSETDPLNQVTTYTYDAQGRMLTRTGPDGAVTTYIQGASGPTSITQSVTASTTRTTGIAYHATSGRPATITDPRGKATTMAYSATTGDLTSVTDPLGHSTTFAYDALGRRTTVTDSLGHTTTTAYDIRGRVTRATNHDGTHTDFTYDKSGRRETVKDPLGRVTRYIYDDFGRLITVLDPLNQATRYGYDLMGNLLTLTDAKGQKTSFEYDGFYRVKKTIYPGGAYETFTYDSRGRLNAMMDRKGTTTTYAYDDLGRLTGKTFSDGTPAFSYAYDIATGRMLTAQNGTDTLGWAYNLAGELLSEQSAKNASTVAYTYDDDGNRLSVSLDGTLFVTYAYDDASRLTSITRGTNVFGFAYDNANRRTSMTYPNGVNTSYTYDNLNRLTNLAATKTSTSTPITNFGYTYDAAGNRTQKSTLDYTEDYGYDPLYRLTRTDRTNPGATPPNQWTWNYDAVGNRTSAQKDSEATTSSYNEKNQLTGATGGGKMLWRGTLDEPGIATFSAPTINGQPARMLAGNVFEATLDLPAGANNVTIQAQDGSGNVATKVYSVNVIGVPSSYTYDANGNLSAKTDGADVWGYSFNAIHQLTAVTKNAVTQATYSYDPIGRRVERISGATTTVWTFDQEDVLRQDVVVGPATTTTRFIHGLAIDEPLAQEIATSGAMAYLHADALGSIVHHTDSSAMVTDTVTYDAWGNVQTGTPSLYGFTAREWDGPSRLNFYRARWYDQSQGRFLSEDPIGFEEGPNFYQYAQQNPALYVDPSGEFAGMGFLLRYAAKLVIRGIAAAAAAATQGDAQPTPESVGPTKEQCPKDRRNCVCYMRCAVEEFGPSPSRPHPSWATGIGVAKDCGTASKLAQVDAKANWERYFKAMGMQGLRLKHCKPVSPSDKECLPN